VSLGGPSCRGAIQLTFFASGRAAVSRDRSPHPIDGLGYSAEQRTSSCATGAPPNTTFPATPGGEGHLEHEKALKLRRGALDRRTTAGYHHQYRVQPGSHASLRGQDNSVLRTASYTIEVPSTFAERSAPETFLHDCLRGDGTAQEPWRPYAPPKRNPIHPNPRLLSMLLVTDQAPIHE